MSADDRTVVDPDEWVVVVPVKLLRTAKTRLGPLPAEDRLALALAMALDTIEAALDCADVAEVVVVTDDEVAGAAAHQLGASVVPDRPNAGLNPALEFGVGEVRRRAPERPVAMLACDVPAARPAELSAALHEARSLDRAVVADTDGDGTVLLTAGPGVDPRVSFGPGSLQRHIAAGAVALTVEVPGLRRDVDTLADLRAALALGCGRRTTALATREVHATVREHSAVTGAGVVLLDDGSELAYDADALRRGGLRLLRSGQRVRLEVATSGQPGQPGQVLRLTIATLEFPADPDT